MPIDQSPLITAWSSRAENANRAAATVDVKVFQRFAFGPQVFQKLSS